MAKSLREWVDTDVTFQKSKPLQWISEEYFFRDPSRPVFSDCNYFFSPADGIILYQRQVEPADCIVGGSYPRLSALTQAIESRLMTSKTG